MGINVFWKDIRVYLVNVYSLCFISNERKLWSQLHEFKFKFSKSEWCVVGDLNTINKEGEERVEFFS